MKLGFGVQECLDAYLSCGSRRDEVLKADVMIMVSFGFIKCSDKILV
jgi:hypothetical protein